MVPSSKLLVLTLSGLDSSIIKTNEHIHLLRNWITNGQVIFKLLYRGTRDGFLAADFH